MNEGSSVKRFPRLLRGEAAGALTTLLWQEPEFSVVATKKKEAVVFKFRVPVPENFQSAYPELWELFFGTGIEHWKKALSASYWQAEWGDKKLSRSLSNQLRVVYRDALGIWLDAWLAHTKDEVKRASQLQQFQKTSKIKRSQPDPWLALRVAVRFGALLSSVRKLRIKLKHEPNITNAALVREIKSHLSSVTPERALGRIFPGEKHCDTRRLFARISDREIAEGYMRCEIDDWHIDLRIHPLKTYIRLGNKIRETLSELTFS